MLRRPPSADPLTGFTPRETEFVPARDGVLRRVGVGDRMPYLQFRGGPKGFVRVLDDQTLGWADFRGN